MLVSAGSLVAPEIGIVDADHRNVFGATKVCFFDMIDETHGDEVCRADHCGAVSILLNNA